MSAREGFVAIVRGYNDRLIKKRFVAVNRRTPSTPALCTSYSSGLQSYAARELGKHVCQNASFFSSLSLSLSFSLTHTLSFLFSFLSLFFFALFIEPTEAEATAAVIAGQRLQLPGTTMHLQP